MRSATLLGFLPSISGLRFANRWPVGPAFAWRIGYLQLALGNVADGLCGGMAFVAADRWLAGEPPPPDSVAPAAGSPLFREIVRRQLDSLDWLVRTPLRIWWASLLASGGRWRAHDQVREWLAIRAELDAGRPAMVGLVRAANANPLRLTTNHQVLAWGYTAERDTGTLRLYDPNYPGRDDVMIEVRVEGRAVALRSATGEPLRAFLHLRYRRPTGGRSVREAP